MMFAPLFIFCKNSCLSFLWFMSKPGVQATLGAPGDNFFASADEFPITKPILVNIYTELAECLLCDCVVEKLGYSKFG